MDRDSIPTRRARKGTPYPVDNSSRRVLGVLRRRREPMPYGEVIDATASEMGFSDDVAGVIAYRVRFGLRNMANGGGR